MIFLLRNLLILLPLVLLVGGGTLLTFIVAPTVFSMLSSRTESGNLVAAILRKLAWIQWSGLVSLIFAEILKFTSFNSFATRDWIVTGLIILLVLTLVFSLTLVQYKIEKIRAQVTSFDELPQDDPLRKAFGMWHGISMLCMILSLVLGAAVLLLEFVPPARS